MIKKIICPTDFSPAATNAAEYAAKLAKAFGAEVLFVTVKEAMTVAALVDMGDDAASMYSGQYSSLLIERLEDLSSVTQKMFNVKASYQIDVDANTIQEVLTDAGNDAAIVVMGTNGVDDVYQYFFNSNTYNVVKNVSCPVLVIPENVKYSSIKKIVFAWDYSSKTKISFSQLNDFMKAFDPMFTFLHVSEHQTEISLDVFRALRSEINDVLGKNAKVEFEQAFDENIPWCINNYMLSSKADLLSLTFYDRGAFKNLFHGQVAKELTETAQYPTLILHTPA